MKIDINKIYYIVDYYEKWDEYKNWIIAEDEISKSITQEEIEDYRTEVKNTMSEKEVRDLITKQFKEDNLIVDEFFLDEKICRVDDDYYRYNKEGFVEYLTDEEIKSFKKKKIVIATDVDIIKKLKKLTESFKSRRDLAIKLNCTEVSIVRWLSGKSISRVFASNIKALYKSIVK